EKAIRDRRTFFDQMPGLGPHLVRRGLLAPVAATGAWAFAALVLHEPALGEVFAGSILGSYAAGGWGMYRGRRLDFVNRQAEKDDRRAALGLPRGPDLGMDASSVTAAAAAVADQAKAVQY